MSSLTKSQINDIHPKERTHILSADKMEAYTKSDVFSFRMSIEVA